jgi:hypothetical protein
MDNSVPVLLSVWSHSLWGSLVDWQGGKDAASARYIFTNVPKITRTIFHPHDDPILNYLDEDGAKIEPEYYLPTVPLVLINGAEGIGTGRFRSIARIEKLTTRMEHEHSELQPDRDRREPSPHDAGRRAGTYEPVVPWFQSKSSPIMEG